MQGLCYLLWLCDFLLEGQAGLLEGQALLAADHSVVETLANGDVKGCPSHPTSFVVGNVRRAPLSQIWEDPSHFTYNTRWDESLLEGACARCDFRRICRGGCTTMAYAVKPPARAPQACSRPPLR